MRDRITTMDIPFICARLRAAKTRGELAITVMGVVSRYSLYDLLHMRGAIEKQLRHLPPSYRQRLFPKLMEQIFGTHHLLICMFYEGKFHHMPESLDPAFVEYCDLVERVCTGPSGYLHPRFDLLYFLLAGFAIFVLHLPGHPVGTPFPGGLTVTHAGGEYLCPIRDKEDEVESAICRFCPARQG